MATATVEVPTPLAVGDGISTHEQFLQLPIGTKVGPQENSGWVKVDHSSWENLNDDSAIHYTQFSLRSRNRVLALPETPPLMTVQQWQWRWLDHIWWSAEQAGVGAGTIQQAQRDLEIPDDMFPIGAGVKMKSYHFRNMITEGSLGYQGTPDTPRRFGLFRRSSGNWVHVLGDVSYFQEGRPVTLAFVPDRDVAEWAQATGTEEDQDLISAFKAKAWRTGWKVKVHHRWCSTYESYMGQIGLTAEVLRETKHNGIRVGERVDANSAALLPVGSVLRWQKADGTDWSWFIRDNIANRAQTRRLFGARHEGASGRNYATSMEVLWIQNGNEGWSIPLTTEEVRALPPGSRMDMDGTMYRIALDGRIAPDDTSIPRMGTWDAEQFGNAFRLVSVG